MRALATAILGLLFVISPVNAQQEEEERPAPATLEELQARIAEILEETETPGVGLSLVARDAVLFTGGIGVADRETGERVTADTVFRIGSITKSFVSLAALILVEEGLLDLDTPVRELAPEIEFDNPWRDTDPVRVVHLLEHTTGWDDMAIRDYAYNVDPPISLREGIDYNPKTRRSRWRPGMSMSYSNSGPPIAAYVMQKITGQDFEDFVHERVFTPLEMPIANFKRPPAVAERLATGYDGDDPVEYWNISTRPSGAINTSAREMANFVQLLVNRGSFGGTRLLKPESIDRMETPRTTRAARAGVRTGAGLGNGTGVRSGLVSHGHNGGMPGYLAEMSYSSNHGLGYAFMINSSSDEARAGISELVWQYLTADLEPDPKTPAVAVEMAVLKSYEGWYEPITPRQEDNRFLERITGLARLTVIDQVLTYRSLFGETWRAVPLSDHLFRWEDDPEDEPIASAAFYDGDASGTVLMDSSSEMRRISTPLVWLQLMLGGASLLLMVSALGFAQYWMPRWLFGKKLKGTPHISVRALPALAAASIVAACMIMILVSTMGGGNVIQIFGAPTFWSVSLCLLTWLFAITSVLALVHSVRHWSSPITRSVRIHSVLSSMGSTIVMLYLLYWGVIGIRTWA
jgi:CubicO group peptidase (beta-lactamase class C family)